MEIKVSSWKEFEVRLDELLESPDVKKARKQSTNLGVIFRGQSNAEWGLETTLERYFGGRITEHQYYGLIDRIQPAITTFTDKLWKLPEWGENKTIDGMPDKNRQELYEYMLYLRHYGFPSPILDWSMSPYVASYFAFREIPSTTDVAIFAFIDRIGAKNKPEKYKPKINLIGQYVNTAKRHHLQQCNYTVCKAIDKETGDSYYCHHEDVINNSKKNQDILYKYIMPASERYEALRKLDILNISAYSLFASEDALMETVFLREWYLKNTF